MGNYKKNVIEINKAKNLFIKWLKDSMASDIDTDKPDVDPPWDYYCTVSGFVDNDLHMVQFMVWEGVESIDYSHSANRHSGISVDQFLKLIAH